MDMDMSSLTSASSASPVASMSGMDGMPGMSSTFSSSTRVTLWFTDWTTTSTATYILTIFFLFALGILNRFLGALKSQLERTWNVSDGVVAHSTSKEKGFESTVRGHVRQLSRALRPSPVRLVDQDGQETEPLSPVPPLDTADEEDVKPQRSSKRRFWVANAPWSVRNDGISAMLEFVRALIGYVLMLAVMTYNIGFLFAVTGSVLLGELIFGRYTRGSASIAEDGCHS